MALLMGKGGGCYGNVERTRPAGLLIISLIDKYTILISIRDRDITIIMYRNTDSDSYFPFVDLYRQYRRYLFQCSFDTRYTVLDKRNSMN